MHWLIYTALYIIIFSIKDIIRKRSLNKFDNMAVLSLEFSFTAVIFFLVALALKIPLEINTFTLTFFGIGILHGLGTVGKINAMNISLSKTALISKYNIFFPMLLGFFFLKEYELLSLQSPEGILTLLALSLFPPSLFLLRNHSSNDSKKSRKTSKIWLFSVVQFFFFHATLAFLMKLNIQPDLIIQAGVFQRLSAGAITLGAAFISKARFPKDKQLFGISTINSILISMSYFLILSALVTAPLILLKPLTQMGTVGITAIAGLFIFGEHKDISTKNKWGYVVTVLGVVLLIVAEVMGMLAT